MSSQNILDDYVLQSKFAVDHDVSEHTVARYRAEPDGLAYAVFGGKVYIHVPSAREWMAKRIRRRSPLRRNEKAEAHNRYDQQQKEKYYDVA